MLVIIICIAVYLITVTIFAVMEYRERIIKPKTIGEVFDYMPEIFLIPWINTFLLVAGLIIRLFYGILKITGIVWLWNKFMNIKL